jgi:4-phosphopantoate--beta-alanine ligase
LVVQEGLIAHGRGEAFDYLLGECTHPAAALAEKAAAAFILSATNPVISVNGNTAALTPGELVELAESIPQAKLEVNLFHRSEERVSKIVTELEKYGKSEIKVLGENPDAKLPGLEYNRAFCSQDGIFTGDVIFVPLEDGDRARALVEMDKTVITIDLNPLSRTARTATVTIVDNIVRAVPNIVNYVKELQAQSSEELRKITSSFDNDKNLKEILGFISERLGTIDFSL